LIKIARNTLYHRPKEKSLEQLKEEMDLRDQIERICLDFPRYGYRRVTKQLQRESWIVNPIFGNSRFHSLKKSNKK